MIILALLYTILKFTIYFILVVVACAISIISTIKLLKNIENKTTDGILYPISGLIIVIFIAHWLDKFMNISL